MNHATNERFVTLDVFRGITVFLMIVVNTPGSGALPFPPLEHAQWNGCTLTDIVFPSFLFAAGNAMYLSAKKTNLLSQKKWLIKILKRSFLIFIIGYLLTWYATLHFVNGKPTFTPFAQTRILAVLQRIALCYLVASLITRNRNNKFLVIACILLLFLYWLLLYLLGDVGSQYSILGNAVRKIDMVLLGSQHMYREKGIIFDPEGLLSTIPSIVNVIAGYMLGRFITQKRKTYETVARLAVAGSTLIAIGLLWNYFLPFNKKLWSGSFVVYTTGIDILFLSILFYSIEMQRIKREIHFFSVLEKNPLFIYVVSNLFLYFLIIEVVPGKVFIDWINEVFFQKLVPGSFGSLLFALSFTMICWFIAWTMDKKKIYVRI